MSAPHGSSSPSTVREWFTALSRQQAGAIGGVSGYIIGLISGPLLRLLLSVGVIILFGFLGRHIEKKFESRLGFIGIIAAILACTSMGPFQKILGNIFGPIISNSSKFAFAILGVHLALRMHDALHSSQDLGQDKFNRSTPKSEQAEDNR
jgi:predicted tellurium resistance membrane protein TerC